jgi:hypothetical protein
MSEISRTLGGFGWFLWQSSTLGAGRGAGALFFWLIFVVLVGVLVHALRNIHSEMRPRLWLLAVLPALWIFIGLWGSFFWVDWRGSAPRNPAWVIQVVNWMPVAFILTGVAIILYLRGARLAATIWFIINLYFLVAMAFLSGMAVTGVWL